MAEGETQASLSFASDVAGLSRIELWADAERMVEGIDPAFLLSGAVDLVTGLLASLLGGGGSLLGGGGSLLGGGGSLLGGGGSPFLAVDLSLIVPVTSVDATVSLDYPGGAGGIASIAFDRIAFDRSFDSHASGSPSGDTLNGTSGEDLIDGMDGDDVLRGGDGNDVLRGGKGDDRLVGDGGADYLFGGEGVDTADYSGSGAAVSVDLDSGIATGGDAEGDTLTGVEHVTGSNHDDALTGDGAANLLRGLDGDDRLVGGGGADVIDGGAGTDRAGYGNSDEGVVVNLATGISRNGHAQGDTLTGIEQIAGSAHGDSLLGDGSDNALYGEAGNDILSGRSGDDVLDGGAGADTLYGGAGEDLASYAGAGTGVAVDLTAGSGTAGNAAGDTLIAVENLEGSAHDDTLVGDGRRNVLDGGDGDDTIDGKGNDDVLRGGGGTDTLDGGSGDDNLYGGAGADALDGGTGEDWSFYSLSREAVAVDLATGTGTGGEAEGDTLSNIENLYGSRRGDTLSGDAGTNLLRGFFGDDTIEGRDGADTLSGGAGADLIDGGNGEDWAFYHGSRTGVAVDLGAGTASGGDATGDVLTGIENLHGSRSDDHLVGDDGVNFLRGGRGDDTLDGGAGDDLFDGGAGADILSGGAGNDRVYYTVSGAGMTVDLAAGTGEGGDAEGDVLTGIERLVGSRHADALTGDANDNQLSGNRGDDTLDGGDGDDILLGGSGADVFVFGDGGADRIADFTGGTDAILIEGVTFDELSITDFENGAQVDYGAGSIRVLDTAAADLTEDDFLFV